MKDEDQTKKQLRREVRVLRSGGAESKQVKGALADANELRRCAEQQLKAKDAETDYPQTKQELERLVHELQVHQIELEMQNDELRRTEAELAKTRDKYSDLYDFSPVGYLTLSEKGKIEEVNLSAATMLGVERGRLQKRFLSHYIHRNDQDVFYVHQKRILETETPQSCDLRMVRSDGKEFHARLECIVVGENEGDRRQIRVAISDITEQKIAEQALRESEEKYRSIVESSIDAVLLAAEEGRIFSANRAACDLFQMTEAELIESGTDALVDLSGPWFQKALEIQPETRNFIEELNFKRKDGTIFSGEVSSARFRDQAGSIKTSMFIRDVSERKRIEEELREKDERLEGLVDIRTEALRKRNKELKCLYDISTMLGLPGITLDEILKRTVMLIPSAWKSTEITAARIVLDGQSFQTENFRETTWRLASEIIVTGKSVGNVEVCYLEEQPESNKGSFPIEERNLLNAIAQRLGHVTERKRAEEKFRQLAVRNQLILNCTGDGIFGVDVEGNIIFVNPAAASLTGYEIDELLGKSLHSILHHSFPDGAQYPLTECPMHLSLNNGKAKRREEVLWKKGGAGFAASYSSTPIIEQDRVVGAVVTLRDITERKRAEEERQKLEARLTQAHKMEAIGTLAGGIAHDFNNILAAVLGYTELALEKVEKGIQLEEYMLEIHTAGLRAKELIKQILAFARERAGELAPIRVSLILKEALKLLRSTIPTSIKLKKNIKSDSLTMADPIQIYQIIMNLCTNAFHSMEDTGGVLEVSLASVNLDTIFTMSHPGLEPGDYLKLSVSDTGTGISPDIMECIFDPYFTTKEPDEGTGLGLAMVHGIVKGYGGEVTVESEVGKGTVFTVYLPITEKRKEKEQHILGDLPKGTERVLFIDDELPIANMGAKMLGHLGYRVTNLTSSMAALELFRSKPNDFDIVISDMTMSHMYGDKLAAELLKIRSDIPIILCTGYSKRISEERIAEYGIKALLQKPIARKDLAGTVRKVLDEAKG